MWPNSKENADLVTFTEEILNGNFIFCAVLVLVCFTFLVNDSVANRRAFATPTEFVAEYERYWINSQLALFFKVFKVTMKQYEQIMSRLIPQYINRDRVNTFGVEQKNETKANKYL